MNEQTKQFAEIFEKHNDPAEVARKELKKVKQQINQDKDFNNYEDN